MIRIDRAQLSFHGFRGGAERAKAIVQRALGALASRDSLQGPPVVRPRVQLTVRVPHGASDAAIADRVHDALRRLDGRTAARSDVPSRSEASRSPTD